MLKQSSLISIEATSNVGTKSCGSVDLAQIRNESRYAGTPRNVRFGSKADVKATCRDVR